MSSWDRSSDQVIPPISRWLHVLIYVERFQLSGRVAEREADD